MYSKFSNHINKHLLSVPSIRRLLKTAHKILKKMWPSFNFNVYTKYIFNKIKLDFDYILRIVDKNSLDYISQIKP
ncbi:hypothetical protein MIDIC_110025 [Alphaproteobacteria bacterium]